MIVAIHYNTPFEIFSREQCDTKIDEVLDFLNLTSCKRTSDSNLEITTVNWEDVKHRMVAKAESSLAFLKMELDLL
jgi:hypothetical protein